MTGSDINFTPRTTEENLKALYEHAAQKAPAQNQTSTNRFEYMARRELMNTYQSTNEVRSKLREIIEAQD